MRFYSDIRNLVAACLLSMAFAHHVSATGAEPAKDLRSILRSALPPPSRVTTTGRSRACGALIDNAKTEKADRIKALIARGAAYERKEHDRPRHRRL